jgi:Flp pilus assembly pilin Flp
MNRPPAIAPAHRRSGHATIEYLVLAALLVLALFAGDPPVAQELATAVRALFRALSYATSLP